MKWNRYANECAEVRWGITEPIQEKGSDLQEDCLPFVKGTRRI